MDARLFVIKQRGRDQFWNCSAEHGAGWNDRHPKQSFSPSELTKEIRRMIDDKTFCDVEILQLAIPGCVPGGDMCEAAMPSEKSNRCPNCGRRY
jgi:hypothetical protein